MVDHERFGMQIRWNKNILEQTHIGASRRWTKMWYNINALEQNVYKNRPVRTHIL